MREWIWLILAAGVGLVGLSWLLSGPPQVQIDVPEPAIEQTLTATQQLVEKAQQAVDGVQQAAVLLQEEAKAVKSANRAVQNMANFVSLTVTAAMGFLIVATLLMYSQTRQVVKLMRQWVEQSGRWEVQQHALRERSSSTFRGLLSVKEKNGHEIDD